MIFRLACGDIQPGCEATFEHADRDRMLDAAIAHAAEHHGVPELTPEVLELLKPHVQQIPA